MGNGWRKLEGKLVLVNLTDGRALRGRLEDTRDRKLTVTNAELFEESEPAGVALEGAVHVDLANVGFVQELAAAPPLPPAGAPARQTEAQ